jgi:hypothetical protein
MVSYQQAQIPEKQLIDYTIIGGEGVREMRMNETCLSG